MSAGKQMAVGDQVFDLRLDFFLCPTHGLFVPSRFSEEWTTDEGCPVLVSDFEETCGEHLTAAFLDTLGAPLSSEQRELLVLLIDDYPDGTPVLTDRQVEALTKAREMLAR